MNKQSIFFTCLVAIVATAITLLAIRRQTKKMSIDPSPNGINHAYTIWAGSTLIAFFSLLKPALELIENSIEIIIHDSAIDNTFFAVLMKIGIFTGFVFATTIVLHFITDWLLKLVYGPRSISIELKNGNTSYFLIRGVVLVFLTYSVLPMYTHLLQWFMPVIETPFYR